MEITIKAGEQFIKIWDTDQGGHMYAMYDVDPDLDQNEEAEDIKSQE